MRFAAGSSAAAARQFSARSISSSIEYLLWLILHHPFSGVLPREADERLKSRTYHSRSSGQLRREKFDQARTASSRACAVPHRSVHCVLPSLRDVRPTVRGVPKRLCDARPSVLGVRPSVRSVSPEQVRRPTEHARCATEPARCATERAQRRTERARRSTGWTWRAPAPGHRQAAKEGSAPASAGCDLSTRAPLNGVLRRRRSVACRKPGTVDSGAVGVNRCSRPRNARSPHAQGLSLTCGGDMLQLNLKEAAPVLLSVDGSFVAGRNPAPW